MTSNPGFRRLAFAFATTFGPLYLIARAKGFALLTVYPSLGIVLLGMHRSKDVVDPAMDFLAPEMWWYGWIVSAAIAAFAIGLATTLLPDPLVRRLWPWSVLSGPVVAMIGCIYLTIPWFRL
jgi:hypothetical protein